MERGSRLAPTGATCRGGEALSGGEPAPRCGGGRRLPAHALPARGDVPGRGCLPRPSRAAALSRRVRVPGLRRGRRAVAQHGRPAGVPDLPSRDPPARRHAVRQDPHAAEDMVRRGLVCHHREERPVSGDAGAHARRVLQGRVDDAAALPRRDGPLGAAAAVGRRGGRRDVHRRGAARPGTRPRRARQGDRGDRRGGLGARLRAHPHAGGAVGGRGRPDAVPA